MTFISIFHHPALLPNFQLPKHKRGDNGKAEINVNPTQVHDHLHNPVHSAIAVADRGGANGPERGATVKGSLPKLTVEMIIIETSGMQLVTSVVVIDAESLPFCPP